MYHQATNEAYVLESMPIETWIRLDYLIKMHQANRWREVKLALYNHKNIRKMMHHVQSRVDQQLREIAGNTYPPSQRDVLDAAPPQKNFRIEWHKHMMQSSSITITYTEGR